MSFLKIIENYMKDNNITLPFIPINEKLLPNCVRRAIISEIKLNNPKVDVSKLFCDLVMDGNNNLYLSVSYDGYTYINILKSYGEYDKTYIYGLKRTELAIMNKAMEYDKCDYHYATKNIDKRFIKPYNDVLSITSIANEVATNFCSYIKYLQEEYDISLKPSVVSIEYVEAEGSFTGIKRISKGGVAPERKYPLIALEDRLSVLNKFAPKFIINATESKKRELTHKAYVYEVEKDSYCIVVEPIDGDSYTKIFFYQGNFCIKYASNFIGGILSLNSAETINNEGIARTKHTTLEMFNNDIGFALNTYYDKVHVYTKHKILLCRNKPMKGE